MCLYKVPNLPFCRCSTVEITEKPSVLECFCEQHNPDHNLICVLPCRLTANANVSILSFFVLPVNKKIPFNPIMQTTSRQEQRQQFSFQPLGSTAR